MVTESKKRRLTELTNLTLYRFTGVTEMFAQIFSQDAAQATQLELLIADLEAQLVTAREQLGEVRQLSQARATAAAAAQDAYEMVLRARAMVRATLGEAGVEEFNSTIVLDHEFVAPLPELPSPSVDNAATNPEPNPEPAPNNDGGAVVAADETIEVTVTATEVVTPTKPDEEVGESHREPDFSRLNWQQLQKLAAANNLSPRGKKRPEIESLLKKQGINQHDINSVA